MAIIPSLLNNASPSTHISKQSIDKLNSLQNIFLQTMFTVSRSCPKPLLCWDSATPLMQVRIDKAKVSLLHHVKNLDNESLAKQIYEEQCHSGWHGLVMECKKIIDDWEKPSSKRNTSYQKASGKL
jgi:hypothetical protein